MSSRPLSAPSSSKVTVFLKAAEPSLHEQKVHIIDPISVKQICGLRTTADIRRPLYFEDTQAGYHMIQHWPLAC